MRPPSSYSLIKASLLTLSLQAFTDIGKFSNFLTNVGNFSNLLSHIRNFMVPTKVILCNIKIGHRWLHVTPASVREVAETRIDQGS